MDTSQSINLSLRSLQRSSIGEGHSQVSDTPELFFDVLAAQRKRLLAVQAKHGDYVSPFTLMA